MNDIDWIYSDLKPKPEIVAEIVEETVVIEDKIHIQDSFDYFSDSLTDFSAAAESLRKAIDEQLLQDMMNKYGIGINKTP